MVNMTKEFASALLKSGYRYLVYVHYARSGKSVGDVIGKSKTMRGAERILSAKDGKSGHYAIKPLDEIANG